MIGILDVLLINPGTEMQQRGTWNREPPLGLLYIAAILEKDGFNCQIIDLSITETPFLEILATIPVPRIIGFTALTNTYNHTLDIARNAKKFYQSESKVHPIFIIGGPHVTFTSEEVLNNEIFDFCFLGEIESVITEFTSIATSSSSLIEAKRKIRKFPRILDQLAFKAHDGNMITSNAFRHLEIDLDMLPLPARHLLPINDPGHFYNTATVIVNRGCPNQCIFCSRQALFKKARWRDPRGIMEELRAIHSMEYAYEYFNMYDNLTISLSFMDNLLDLMVNDDKVFLPWGCELRADMVSKDIAKKLHIANCRATAVGIESANDEILKTAGKFQSIDKVNNGLGNIKDAGLAVQAYFVVGLPGETISTFEETISFIEKSNLEPKVDKIDFFAVTPYPGSKLLERRNELGVQILDSNYDHYDCQHITCKPPGLSLEQLEEIWARAKEFESSFNMKP